MLHFVVVFKKKVYLCRRINNHRLEQALPWQFERAQLHLVSPVLAPKTQ